jgi:hypothetical protein
MPYKKSWTIEDNERLRAFVTTNASIIKAAAALKRTTVRVRRQARILGMPFPAMSEYRKNPPYNAGAVGATRAVSVDSLRPSGLQRRFGDLRNMSSLSRDAGLSLFWWCWQTFCRAGEINPSRPHFSFE